MKALLRKIRQILKDRRTRKIFTRFISTVAAIVVFVTTYALVLPAITMESQAMCGIEAHQHSDSCYEKRLTCGLEESETHTHTDSCYEKVLVCGKENHTHSTACYHLETATAGAPIEIAGVASTESAALAATETASSDPAASAAAETTSFDPASSAETGSQDDSSLFGTDTSSHAGTTPANTTSADTIDPATNSALTDTTDTTFTENNADTESIADTEDTTNTEDKSSIGTPADPEDNTAADPADTAATEASADFENQKDTSETSNADPSSADPASEDFSDASHTTTSDQPTTDTNDTTSQTTADIPADTPDGTDNAATTAPADPANGATKAEPVSAGYVPALEELNFNTILNKNTTVYYHRQTSEDKPAEETTADDTEEKLEADSAVDDTEEKPAADSATDENENTTAADITDWKQTDKNTVLGENDLLRVYLAYTIPAGSLNETNPTARYRIPENIHLTDAQIDAINTNVNGIAAQYINYETLEITDLDAYNKTLGIEAVDGDRTPADDLNEYLQNHNNEEFISATVRAENIYDNTELSDEMAEETPSANTFEDKTTADEENAFLGTDLVFTFSPYAIAKNQHEYDKDGKPTKAGEKIRGWLCLDLTMDQIDWIEAPEDSAENLKSAEIIFAAKDKELGIDEISTELKADYTATTAQGEETPGASAKTAEENAKTEKDSALNEKDKEESEEAKNESEDTENYPAISFDDRITVYAGTLSSDTEETDRPQEQTELTVHIEAEEGTFPVDTTMKLSTVEDMDSVAEAVGTAVEGQTKGFHAVDIAFYNTEGLEIEPLKPIKVSMTSEAIKQAVEDTSTVPVVVHVEDTAKKSEQETQDAEEDSVANNNKNDNAEASGSTELTGSIMQTEQVSQSETTDQNNDQASEDDTVVDTLTFEAGTFSVYAVVYTVDFHWEVNGKEFEFSLAGGGFVSFSELVRALGIASDEADTEKNEVQELIDGVESIVFSNPELVSISKVNEDTTVGSIKDGLGLEYEYSAELTDEEIAEINTQEAKAGDWAIIALKPFQTEEALTVTMKNGDQFTVRVTDANVTNTNFNQGEGYVIYTIYPYPNGKIYALRDDGETGEFSSLAELDTVGNEYKWKISEHYTETSYRNRFQPDFGYTYYNIRSYNDDSLYVNLNTDSSNVVQKEASDVFVINHSTVNGAFAFGASKNGGFGFLRYNLPVPMQMNTAGEFTSDLSTDYWGTVPGINNWWVKPEGWQNVPTYTPIFIYQQPGSAYEFSVATDDIQRGTVKGKTKDDIDNPLDSIFITKTQQTSSDTKTNLYRIQAIPRADQDFDYWTLDGVRLNGVGADIQPGTISIPRNGAELVAHFKNKPNYEDPEYSGRDFLKDEINEWLEAVQRDQKALTECDKTAEVYDYENRIYRVDFTAKSHLSTFDGTVDLGFVLDVSASMKFPSVIDENSNPAGGAKNLSQINDSVWNPNKGRYTTRGELWGLVPGTKYYYVTDKDTTSTVVCVEWNNSTNQWWQHDASNSTNKPFTGDNSTWKSGGRTYYQSGWSFILREAGDPVTQEDLDDPLMFERLAAHGLNQLGATKTRAVYLEYSTNKVIQEMREMMNTFALSGSNADKPPKVAYNEFCGWIQSNNNTHVFQAVDNPNTKINFSTSSYAGGTSTDIALLDAAGKSRKDLDATKNDGYKYKDNQKLWAPHGSNKDTTITNETVDRLKGFQWDTTANTKKYVILITDGAPQRQARNINDETTNLLEEAKAEFPSGTTLLTVGLSMKDVVGGSKLLYKLADRDETYNRPFYYKAEEGNDLIYVIYDILRTVVKPVVVVGDVDDTISEAFYPVDKATGNPLNADEWIDINGNKVASNSTNRAGQIRKDSNGRYTVHWGSQNIPQTGWHGRVYVKAKEDLLGANAALSNAGDAVIQATGYKYKETDTNAIPLKESFKTKENSGKAELPTPRVNVNELSITSNSTDWTVYLGETVDPLSELNQLYSKIDVLQVIKDGTDANSSGIDTRVSRDTNTNRVNTNMSFGFPENVDEERSDGREAGDRQTFPFKSLIRQLYTDAPAGAEWKQNFNSDGTPKWDKLLEDFEANGSQTERQGIRIPYNPYGIPGDNYISLILDVSKVGNETVLTSTDTNPHATSELGNEVEKYTLTVRYDPDYTILPKGQKGEADIRDFHVGEYESKYQGNGAGREERENVHTINVYAKPMDVLKYDDDNHLIDDKPAVFRLLRVWTNTDAQDADSQSRKVTLTAADGYKLNGAALIGDFYLVEEKATESGIAHFGTGADITKLLSADKDPYYLIEWTPPQGYQKDSNAKTITVTPGDNFYTALDKSTSLSATQIASQPYNWTQGVRIKVDSESTVFVNASGQVIKLYKDANRTQERDYLLKEDVAGVAFSTKVIDIIADKIIKLLKVGVNNTDPTAAQTKLAGAKFTIYKATGTNNDQKGDVVVIGEGANAQTLSNLESKTASGLIWTGKLPIGTYLVEEVDAPDGYNKLPVLIRLTVSEDGVNVSVVGTTGNPSGYYEIIDPEGSGADTVYGLKIINIAGAALPNTGGPGTTLSYLLGIMLTGLAGTGLVMRRRRQNAA